MLLSSKCLIVASLLLLCACASNPETINVTPTTSSTTTTTGLARYGSADPLVGLQDALARRALEQQLVLVGRAQGVEAAKTTVRAAPVWHAPTAAASTPITSAGDYHSWPDWPLWHAVGLCEQRGDTPDGIAWYGSPAGGLPGSGYPGGLGLSRDFWNQFAPLAGVTVTNGAYASPGEQIRVARAGSHNGTRMGGWSSWGSGCIQRQMAAGN